MTAIYNFDDDRAYDEHGVLRDGCGVRVSKMMRDAMPDRATCDSTAARFGVTHSGGWNRPGSIVLADADLRDAGARARVEAFYDTTQAWRGPRKDGAATTQNAPKGTVPAGPGAPNSQSNDDAAGRSMADRAYEQMIHDLENAWRRPAA
jgi:hypothetical protein